MSGKLLAVVTVIIILGACIAGGIFGALVAKKKWKMDIFCWKKKRANDMFANIKTPDRTALEKEAREFEEYIRQKRSTQLNGEDKSVSLDDDATIVGKKNRQSSE